MKVEKILVPVDFSENAGKVLRYGVEIAEKFGAEIHVLFVAQIFQDYSEFFVPHMPVIQFEEELVASARDKMAAFIEENLKTSSPCLSKVLVGDPAESLLQYSRDQQADMIVMGTHGYKGLEKVLFGSVAEKVVKMAPCPVLTFNPNR